MKLMEYSKFKVYFGVLFSLSVGLGGSWGEVDDVHPRRQIQTADYKRKLKILSTGILKTTSGHGWGVLVGMGPGLRTPKLKLQLHLNRNRNQKAKLYFQQLFRL